jgi:hypothetical protein
MPTSGSWVRSGRLLAAFCAAVTAGVSAQAPQDVEAILGRVEIRIEEFYKRAQSLMCMEKVTAQPIGFDMSMQGFARVLEYELRVEMAATDGPEAHEANFVRELRKVNGRAPKPRDLDDRNTCLDPNPLTPEPLTFLLAKNRAEYTFSWAGYGRGRDANTILVDYRPIKIEKPAYMEDAKGREDCFQLSLPVERRGRMWIDARTYDVLRIEQHLATQVEVRVPFAQQRRHNLPDAIVVDRYDLITRYKAVAFDDPQETLLLPASIEQLAVMHGAQSNRKTQVFSNYKRFITGGRIVK